MGSIVASNQADPLGTQWDSMGVLAMSTSSGFPHSPKSCMFRSNGDSKLAVSVSVGMNSVCVNIHWVYSQ